MSPPAIASTAIAALMALLSLIAFFRTGSNLTLQTELQKRTQDIQTQQQEIEQQKQQIQLMQQQVNTATQLSQQLGPQVIGSLKIVAMRGNNARIFALLAKYGVQVTDSDKEQIKKLLEEQPKANSAPANTNPPPAPAPAKP
jgi:7-keto-8-aminopelargonate synthetase-like enzyme